MPFDLNVTELICEKIKATWNEAANLYETDHRGSANARVYDVNASVHTHTHVFTWRFNNAAAILENATRGYIDVVESLLKAKYCFISSCLFI